MELPVTVLERVMRKAGAKKLTEGSVYKLNEEVLELAEEVAKDAIKKCKEDGRTELTAEDVRYASEA